MKLNSWLNFSSLKHKLGALIILVVVIPIIITSSIVLSFWELDARSQEETKRKIENQIKFTLVLALENITSDASRLSQSNPFLDYLSVPENLKVYSENRLFGIAHEVSLQSQMRPAFILMTPEKTEAFRFSEGIDLSFMGEAKDFLGSGFHFDSNFLYFTLEIKLDDQQLQGPSARFKGTLITVISMNELKKKIPELKEIVHLDPNLKTENIQIAIAESKFKRHFSLIYFLVGTSGLLILAILLGVFFVNRKILIPISNITKRVQLESNSGNLLLNEDEIEILDSTIRSYQENIKKSQIELVEQSRLSALVSLASQVAHDIRSPLTALNMVISTLDRIPEEKRIIIRSAIQRINDIANDLLARGKPERKFLASKGLSSEKTSIGELNSVVMLSSIVDSLVSEKRIQFRDKINVLIDLDLSQSYGLFACIPPNEFKTVLSNLINNSVEAFENESGRVTLILHEENNKIKLEISDNGKGFPLEIIPKLGEMGTTFGKMEGVSGSGLGIYHAKKTIEGFGGSIIFDSKRQLKKLGGLQFDVNTTITIVIPRISSPEWFVEKVVLPIDSKIAVLDDDYSIHSIWQGRIVPLFQGHASIPLVSFTSMEIFRRWAYKDIENQNKTIFLVDFEFIGQSKSGLDLIEELQIQKKSILVTSRYDEPDILARCLGLGVPIIPKAMAGLVPIIIESENYKYDAVLIDDDSLVHMTWNLSAKEHQKTIRTFLSVNDFLIGSKSISKETPVFVDSNLGKDLKGEVLAAQIFELGFKRIFITTGHIKDEIEKFDYISDIVGKEPLWH